MRTADTDPNVYFDWNGATIETLQSFFVDWYIGKPDGLNKIQPFSWLYYDNLEGVDFVMHGIGRR